MMYVPKPIDTAGVELPPEIAGLAERLAEHAHDVWARERIAQGWTHGPKRDDAAKHHPCLVPYKDLHDSEKVYDRNAALQTLKAILKLGYRISKAPTPK
jgi:ryanodine receptor 2